MMISEFIDKTQDSYEGKYKANEIQEIQEILSDIDEDQRYVLYKYMRNNYDKHYIPRFKYFNDTIKALGFKKYEKRVSANLHEQSPFQQVVKHQDKSVDQLLQEVKRIRDKDVNSLLSAEVSFLVYWEKLGYVPETFRDVMKRNIVNDDQDEIDALLKQVEEKIPFDKIDFGVYTDIPF